MHGEVVRMARDATPFVPFIIHMADGRSYRVAHPEVLAMSPNGETLILFHQDNRTSIVYTFLVNELLFHASTGAISRDAA